MLEPWMVPIAPTHTADMVILAERTLTSFFFVVIQTHTFLFFCVGVVIGLVVVVIVVVVIAVVVASDVTTIFFLLQIEKSLVRINVVPGPARLPSDHGAVFFVQYHDGCWLTSLKII